MNEWQKVAFLEEEIIPSLNQQLEILKTLTKNKWIIAWYEQAIKDIQAFKTYFINKESDEQDYKEAVWAN